jgi:hypothetical protein
MVHEMTGQISETVRTMIDTGQMVSDLLRDGSRAKHEAEMALNQPSESATRT